ncbi:MAG: molecular chaperone [candidate division Zixibacteria bacterium]|nr:molecular chaperone [candidate division Zixibacteria bacterium]
MENTGRNIWRNALAQNGLSGQGRFWSIAFLTLFLSLWILPAEGWTQVGGGLSVMPTRIVFEGRDRTAEIVLTNRGAEAETYRITFKSMRMLEDGSYEDIEEPRENERFAADLIRYSPRRVVLEPGTSQTLRLMLRKPADLAEGEYRSHMYFRAVPKPSSASDIEEPDLKEDQINIQITTIFGITIPIIVRHGDLSSAIEFSDLALDLPIDTLGLPNLSFRLHRTGNRSVYGDFTITYIPDNSDKEYVVGWLNGVAVYTPNLTRSLFINIHMPEGVEIDRSTFRISYRARKSDGGGILAEAELRFPPE